MFIISVEEVQRFVELSEKFSSMELVSSREHVLLGSPPPLRTSLCIKLGSADYFLIVKFVGPEVRDSWCRETSSSRRCSCSYLLDIAFN